MDKEDASTRFRKLASGDKRPDTARLRDIFDDVEVALKAKVPQTTVLAELESLGFTMKLAGFKSALQRIRKERKETKIETTPPLPEPAPEQSSASLPNDGNEKPDAALVRPPGISNSAWSEMQVKHAKANRI